jgi:hypothetical protein
MVSLPHQQAYDVGQRAGERIPFARATATTASACLTPRAHRRHHPDVASSLELQQAPDPALLAPPAAQAGLAPPIWSPQPYPRYAVPAGFAIPRQVIARSDGAPMMSWRGCRRRNQPGEAVGSEPTPRHRHRVATGTAARFKHRVYKHSR